MWQGSKIPGEWKPSLATVYQKAQLSPIHFILGSKVVTTYSSSERVKGTESAEDKPPTSKMTGLSGKCSKLQQNLLFSLPSSSSSLISPTEEAKLYHVHWASSLHSSRSTLQDALSLSALCSGAELYGFQQGFSCPLASHLVWPMEDTSRRSEGRRRVSSRYLFCWLPLSPGYCPDTESDRCAPSAVSGTGAHQYPCLLHCGDITLPRDCTYLGLHHQFLPMEVTCVVRSRQVFSRLSLFPHLLTMYRASRGL